MVVMMATNNNIFVKITNQDIYNKLCQIENHVIETNGKVKMNRILSRVALCVALLALSIITGINLVGLI